MVKKMKQIAELDRPREKMSKKGPKGLSNLELVAVLLASGNRQRDVMELAHDIARLTEKDFKSLSIESLCLIEGVGVATACRIMAAVEFSRRFLLHDGIKINDYHDVLKLVGELQNKKQEYFLTLTLDGAHHLIQKRTVFIGTLTQSLIHPREIFADAISDRAAGIILIHNHPDGHPEPSLEDIEVTRQLTDAAKILGIEILDHIIVGKGRYFSFQSHGMLPLP
jgi:DNA repair protein RadC